MATKKTRTKLVIGAVVGTLMQAGAPCEVRPVTVKKDGKEHSSRVYFAKVNQKAIWSFGECDDATFDAINSVLSQRGERAMFKVLAEDAS